MGRQQQVQDEGGMAMAKGRGEGGVRQFGTGRIVFWRGGSVWIGHVAEETGFHSHHAIQITLALSGGMLRLRRPGEQWHSYPAAIVAAHQEHAFEARGERVALVFAEPESREGRGLRQRFRDGVAALEPDALAGQLAQLVSAYENHAADDDLGACARAVTARLAAIEALPARPLDKRIERGIDVLRDRLGESVTMTDIAAAVHLSPERFRHLFLQETGIRFRPYVLWLRIEQAVAAYAAGSSLTEASHAGGFADSAHFSRTFKRMFGVPAVGVQRTPVPHS